VDFNRYLQNMPERQKQRHSHAELIHVLDSIDLLVCEILSHCHSSYCYDVT